MGDALRVVIPLQNRYLNNSSALRSWARLVVIPLQNRYLNNTFDLSTLTYLL